MESIIALPSSHTREARSFGAVHRIVAQLFCAVMTGHLTMTKFSGDRMCLQCYLCGKSSPGWSTRKVKRDR